MKEKGCVIEITSFGANISLSPSAACQGCTASDFCRPKGDDRITEAENRIGAKIGDEVYVEISSKTGLLAFFLLFGLPVILGLVGLLIYPHAQNPNIHGIIYGLAGFALGLIIAKVINNILGRKHKFLPRIVEILSSKDI